MAQNWWIYGLSDPREEIVRYVGQTLVSPGRRFSGHLHVWRHHEKRGRGSHINNWLRQLGREGVAPTLTVLEEGFGELAEASAAEVQWIKKLREAGADLLNLTDGGEGRVGASHTLETRAKIGAAQRRFFAENPEARFRQGQRMKRVWEDPETRARHAAAWERRSAALERSPERLPEEASKGDAARRQAWENPARREAASQALAARWGDPGFREKTMQAIREACAAPESRQKRVEAQKAVASRSGVKEAQSIQGFERNNREDVKAKNAEAQRKRHEERRAEAAAAGLRYIPLKKRSEWPPL